MASIESTNQHQGNNEERDWRRYVTTSSIWARKVPGLRHLDLDLFQYCNICTKPELFIEVKSSVPKGGWAITKILGKSFGVPAALVIEPFRKDFQCSKASGCDCDCHTHPVHKTIDMFVVPDEQGDDWNKTYTKQRFLEFLQNCHQAHLDTGACKRGWFNHAH